MPYTCSWIKSWAFCLVAVTVIKSSGFFPVSILSLLKKSLSISYKMTVANSAEALDLSPLLIQMGLTPIGGSDIVLFLFLFSLLPVSLSSTYTVPWTSAVPYSQSRNVDGEQRVSKRISEPGRVRDNWKWSHVGISLLEGDYMFTTLELLYLGCLNEDIF